MNRRKQVLRQGRQGVPQFANRGHLSGFTPGFTVCEDGKPKQPEIATWVVEGEAGQWKKVTDPLTGADLPGITIGLFGLMEDQISQPFEMGYREGVEVGYMAAMDGEVTRHRVISWPFGGSVEQYSNYPGRLKGVNELKNLLQQ